VDAAVATLAGRIYADLERAGRPIGRADPLVAAAALVHGCDLITGNVAHFEVVRGVGYPLMIDNWHEPAADWQSPENVRGARGTTISAEPSRPGPGAGRAHRHCPQRTVATIVY